jgi:hypothetical protein
MMFEANSRYARKAVKLWVDAQGEEHAYAERRLLPRDEALKPLAEARMREGDRLDLVAFKFYGDSTQSWRLLDAQHIHLDPKNLAERDDQVLRITLPEPGV